MPLRVTSCTGPPHVAVLWFLAIGGTEALSTSRRGSSLPQKSLQDWGEPLPLLRTPGEPESFFGGRRKCDTEFVRQSFSISSLLDTEESLGKWIMHLDEKVEAYNNGRSSNFSLRAMQDDSPPRKRFFVAFPPQGPNCTSPLQWFGDPKIWDEQKPICDGDGRLLREGADCDIISIGSRNLWSTEVSMYNKTSCRIHTFDCSSADSRPDRIRDRASFYQVCIGAADKVDKKKREFQSWPTLLRTAGILKAPEYLKMDVEGFEFETMRSMLQGDPSLLPNQIAMEIHHETTPPNGRQPASQLSWSFRGKDTGELLAFIMMLYTAGYRLSYVNVQTICTHCLEVLLTKIYC